MLGQPGYNGCKTGITDAAGPCVSVTYQKDGFYYVIILLNAKSMEARWQEVPLLVEYARHKSGRQVTAASPLQQKTLLNNANLLRASDRAAPKYQS